MKNFYLIITVIVIFSCKLSNSEPNIPTAVITFPQSNATYSFEQNINFSCDTNLENVAWYDKDNNYISSEKSFSIKADNSLSKVYLKNEDNLLDSIDINIIDKYTTISYTLSDNEISMNLKLDDQISIISFGPETSSINIEFNNTNNRTIQINTEPISKNKLFKDVNINFSNSSSPVRSLTSNNIRKRSLSLTKDNFFISDITGSNGGAAYLKEFTIIESGVNINYWWDNENGEITPEMLSIITKIEEVYYQKVTNLWGDLLDSDSNSVLNILLTKELNESNLAIGFFNPNDLYTNDSDNPYSNEGEFIYLGIPDNTTFAFSENSLLATFVHETTHLLNFQHKTYSESLKGNPSPPKLDLFLDEGLAHLTESLCGLGISGGNIAFYKIFLQSPQNYSLVGNNYLGQSDSAGKRGAVAGFLSWLFWERGGLSFGENNELIDGGGMEFLRSIVISDNESWDAISSSYSNKTTNSLFQLWVNNLIVENNYVGINDNVTMEPLYLDPFMGEININSEYTLYLDGVEKVLLSSIHQSILPYSFIPYKTDLSEGELKLSNFTGNSFVKLYTTPGEN